SCYTSNWAYSAPRITLNSTDATLTKNTESSSDYNNTIETLNLYNSDVSVLFIYVQHLNAYNSSRVHNQNAEFGSIYLDSTSALVGNDNDFDGLSDDAENQIYYTDPNNPDSDGDGYGDGEEIQFGGNATDPLVFPADLENPTLTDSGIANQTTYNQHIILNLDALDNRGIDHVSVLLNGSEIFHQDVPLTEYWMNGNISATIDINTKDYTDGNYILQIQAYDIHNHLTETNYEIEIDNTPAFVNLVGPNNLENNSYTVSGILLQFEFSETPQMVFYAWDGSLNSTLLQYIPVGDGLHYLDIYTCDPVGNWFHTQYNFIVDDASVLVYLMSPSNSSYVHSNTAVNLTFSKSPSNVYYSWDGQMNSTELTVIPAIQGQHTLDVWTNSTMGVLYHVQYRFIVDDFAPEIYLISPEANSTQESGYMIDITYNEEIQAAYYAWDGGENFTTTPVLPLGDGLHYLDVYVCDFVPNWNYTRYYFTTDDPLIIALNSPEEGSILLSDTMINLTITGTPGTYIFNWDNGENESRFLFEMPYTPIIDGIHILNIFISDSLGNSMERSYSFTIQNPLIQISLISPEMNSILKFETHVNLNFSETPSQVFYSWNGGDNSTELSTIPAIEGQYILDVYAQNIHGSWNHAQFIWTVDLNDAPSVEIIYPTGGEMISESMTITWQGSDPDNDLLTYDLYFSPDLEYGWMNIASGLTRESYTWDISANPAGTYFVKVVVSDGYAQSEDVITIPITIQESNTNENPFDNFNLDDIPGFPLESLAGFVILGVGFVVFRKSKSIKKKMRI
ncbi:MAG: hypothetical protein ACTSVU_00600, partial [Promethearchaeota archaeon]